MGEDRRRLDMAGSNRPFPVHTPDAAWFSTLGQNSSCNLEQPQRSCERRPLCERYRKVHLDRRTGSNSASLERESRHRNQGLFCAWVRGPLYYSVCVHLDVVSAHCSCFTVPTIMRNSRPVAEIAPSLSGMSQQEPRFVVSLDTWARYMS